MWGVADECSHDKTFTVVFTLKLKSLLLSINHVTLYTYIVRYCDVLPL